MARLTFAKATKEQSKLRLALFGPSGAGKTYTALRIAKGMGGRVAVIDTERGSASKYADLLDFDVLELPKNDIATYIEGIKAAAGYKVLIIDSLSHAWRELLQAMDDLARAKYSGNKWSAWSEGTPQQNSLVDALLGFDGHVIATMRSKTEWVIQQDERGKNAPRRIGTSPEQGKGIEYEFDLLMEISPDHIGTVTKDRTGKYQDRVIDCPGEELGAALAEWLSTGASVTVTHANPSQRPYDPETVRRGLASRIAKGDTRPPQASVRGATVGAMEALFASPTRTKEARTHLRHQLTTYLLGEGKGKPETWTEAECFALLEWGQIKDDTGEYAPHEMATKEAEAIVLAADASNGQKPLM